MIGLGRFRPGAKTVSLRDHAQRSTLHALLSSSCRGTCRTEAVPSLVSCRSRAGYDPSLLLKDSILWIYVRSGMVQGGQESGLKVERARRKLLGTLRDQSRCERGSSADAGPLGLVALTLPVQAGLQAAWARPHLDKSSWS